jgi:hypothetical protein
LATPNADIYLHPDDAQDINAWRVEEAQRKWRLN